MTEDRETICEVGERAHEPPDPVTQPHARTADASRSESAGRPKGPRLDVVTLILVILLLAAIRWRLRDMPLERDEGEYGYAGQLILQGVPPYQIAYNMKLPGTYVAYAVIMAIFGQTPAGIHVGLLFVNALTILLVYALGKRLFRPLAGVVAAASYGLLSVGPWVNGFAGHATHFVVVAAIAGLWLLLKAIDEQSDWKIFCAGLLLGVAFLMKQPGAAFTLFGALYLLKSGGWTKEKLRSSARHLLWFGAGAALPFAITCLVLWRAGVFAKFWFWTFSYAYQYGTSVGTVEGWHSLVKNFTPALRSALAVWLLSAVGLSCFVWSRKARAHVDFVIGLLFFSGLAVSAGLYFRRHYFIMLLPVVSLLVGLAVSSVVDLAEHRKSSVLRYVAMAAFVIAFASAMLEEMRFYFQADPISASRHVYPEDPFPEAAVVGRYIQQHSAASASIAVLGSEPQIMFYARRRSATGYLYAYPLTEEQEYASTMQQEVISEIEAANPEYLVFAWDWEIRPQSERAIFTWADQYIANNYGLAGVMRVRDGLQFRSENEVRRTPGHLWAALFLFRRK